MKKYIRSQLLSQHGVRHGFSSKADGNLSDKWGEADAVHRARLRFFYSVFAYREEDPVFRMEEVHGMKVRNVSGRDSLGPPECGTILVPGVDGLVAAADGRRLALAGTFADCLPLYAYDPEAGIIGLGHAGWRGVIGGVCESLMGAMAGKGSRASMCVFIGPSIHSCCFLIDEDVYPLFAGNGSTREHMKMVGQGRHSVDLQASCLDQLRARGVKEENIEVSSICTACDERFFSHRREGSARRGLNMGVISVLG